MKRGKKYTEAAKAVNRGNLYDPEEAISLVKKTAVAKFDETIEAHIRTGCDGRHAEQQIRGALYFLTEQVRLYVYWYSLRMLRQMRHRQQALTT